MRLTQPPRLPGLSAWRAPFSGVKLNTRSVSSRGLPDGAPSIPLLSEKTAGLLQHTTALISDLTSHFFVYKHSTSRRFPSILLYIPWLWPRQLAILPQALLANSLRQVNLLLGKSPRVLFYFFFAASAQTVMSVLSLLRALCIVHAGPRPDFYHGDPSSPFLLHHGLLKF